VLGGSSYTLYTGLIALILNVAAAVALQLLLGERGAMAEGRVPDASLADPIGKKPAGTA
jgi:hypothetical protein